MRIVRYEQGGHAGTGILEGGIVHEVEGHLFEGPRPGASIAPIGQVSLLPPVRPEARPVEPRVVPREELPVVVWPVPST